MKIRTVGEKIGFLTGMILFITIFHFILSLKFNWLSNYLPYFNALYISIALYVSYLIVNGVRVKWKK